MPTYAFDDVGGTYQAGKQITATKADAQSAGNAFLTALDNVTTGDGTVDAAVDSFRTDCVKPVNKMATDVEKLGNNTSSGAVTAQQTQNDATTTQNAAGALTRTVNTNSRVPLAV